MQHVATTPKGGIIRQSDQVEYEDVFHRALIRMATMQVAVSRAAPRKNPNKAANSSVERRLHSPHDTDCVEALRGPDPA